MIRSDSVTTYTSRQGRASFIAVWIIMHLALMWDPVTSFICRIFTNLILNSRGIHSICSCMLCLHVGANITAFSCYFVYWNCNQTHTPKHYLLHSFESSLVSDHCYYKKGWLHWIPLIFCCVCDMPWHPLYAFDILVHMLISEPIPCNNVHQMALELIDEYDLPHLSGKISQ